MKTVLRILQQHLWPAKPQVQILSDLHLEIGQQYSTFTFPATAPFLLLAGDIGRLIDYDGYRSFLESQAARYTKVFLVLGNHEFYGMDYASGLETARRLSQEPSLSDKVVLLHRSRWDDPNSCLTILGCTLWSAIPEDACALVEGNVNDFKQIKEWTAHNHNKVHSEEVAWLRDEVVRVQASSQSGKRSILVVSHHAPCIKGSSRPEHDGSPWTPAFATDLVEEEWCKGVKVWAFGHTHYSNRFWRNGIKLVSNQRGYTLPGGVSLEPKFAGRKPRYQFDAALAIAV
ncbi:ser/Thr protein phosphatase superfamily [Canariomyces notabilis]|uniref:Ser/Thr protein phosphatase superfamily n=1 Tax=Canariomyces notabilis TaxID=2074819 RepID=A0AAN6YQC4_9PEZI|nr:ser/Thr protein phosphatase superfamily [Canariomyces arenarius]